MTPKQEQAIRKHGEQLNAIFHTGLDPLTLCKKLRRIEGAAHRLGEDCCNYLSMESLEYDKRIGRIRDRIADTLGETWTELEHLGVFINMDPRGYALKIDATFKGAPNLHRDFGGYGILAPEIDKEGN